MCAIKVAPNGVAFRGHYAFGVDADPVFRVFGAIGPFDCDRLSRRVTFGIQPHFRSRRHCVDKEGVAVEHRVAVILQQVDPIRADGVDTLREGDGSPSLALNACAIKIARNG